ncbi:hypothetical protein B0T20DRAFT_176237 [Sordaria brevicollis]|uniref:Uncharacterized protein n=1 Tax=Sordaria brevicollis TaxID=83679 RepID=A0AAE0PHK6_SORBR|nr:hypothetical protein B0T20DRAFT_176237 [Sordaria brevicollis]
MLSYLRHQPRRGWRRDTPPRARPEPANPSKFETSVPPPYNVGPLTIIFFPYLSAQRNCSVHRGHLVGLKGGTQAHSTSCTTSIQVHQSATTGRGHGIPRLHQADKSKLSSWGFPLLHPGASPLSFPLLLSLLSQAIASDPSGWFLPSSHHYTHSSLPTLGPRYSPPSRLLVPPRPPVVYSPAHLFNIIGPSLLGVFIALGPGPGPGRVQSGYQSTTCSHLEGRTHSKYLHTGKVERVE